MADHYPEDKAHLKWCPHARCVDEDVAGFNRCYNGDIAPSARCLGSACSQWESTIKREDIQWGRCGLATSKQRAVNRG